jgi:pilus assembly protein TadC
MTALAMGTAILAVWVVMPKGSRSRMATVFPRKHTPNATKPSLTDRRVIRLVSALSGLGIAVAWGGVWGWLLGLGVAVIGPIVLGRWETRGARVRREAMERQGADAADLLAACLASGAPILPAVGAVSRALGPPISEPLESLRASLLLGADPHDAWSALTEEPGLAGVARAVRRSMASGAPLAQVLPGVADDIRRQTRAQVEAAARAAGVKAVLPLAACFLPAFLLVGIAPIIASLAIPLLTGT